jgi:hypothetical protein
VLPGLPQGVPFTPTNVTQAPNRSGKTPGSGGTVLYEDMDASVADIKSAPREKALIVVSDGAYTASTRALAQVMQAIEELDATVYTTGIYDEDDPDNSLDVVACFRTPKTSFLRAKKSPKIFESVTPWGTRRSGDRSGTSKIKVTTHMLVKARTSYLHPGSK